MASSASSSEQEYKRGSKVVLLNGIPGVPEGTRGKLGRSLGFSLKRYRVRFDNKTETMSIAHDMLVPEKEWPKFKAAREKARAQALEEAQAKAAQPAAPASPKPAAAPVAEAAPAPAEASPVPAAPPASSESDEDPRLAKLLARSQSARDESGVPSPAAAETAPAAPAESEPASAEPEPAAATNEPAAKKPDSPMAGVKHEDPPTANIEVVEPEVFVPGPDIDARSYSTNDRVSELLAKVRGG